MLRKQNGAAAKVKILRLITQKNIDTSRIDKAKIKADVEKVFKCYERPTSQFYISKLRNIDLEAKTYNNILGYIAELRQLTNRKLFQELQSIGR